MRRGRWRHRRPHRGHDGERRFERLVGWRLLAPHRRAEPAGHRSDRHGCRDDLPQGDFILTGVITDAETGEQHTFSDFRSDFQVTLNAARINSDGTFSAENVALYSARNHQQLVLGITSQGGSWGGCFSSISATTGGRFGDVTKGPRLVAGTFGSRAKYTDGSLIAFVGTFGAGKQ